jgi:hypothetical protein
MYEYLAKIKEIKGVEPHAGQYKVFYATCPFCNYTCELHATDKLNIQNIYPKCHVCNKKMLGTNG